MSISNKDVRAKKKCVDEIKIRTAKENIVHCMPKVTTMFETKQCDGCEIVLGEFGLSNCYLLRGNIALAGQVQFNFLTRRDRVSSSGQTARPSIV
jgi:hypothetical protein